MAKTPDQVTTPNARLNLSIGNGQSANGNHMTDKRRYSLLIWALGLGYYLSYTPYSGLTKALSSGLLPGTHGAVSGPRAAPKSRQVE